MLRTGSFLLVGLLALGGPALASPTTVHPTSAPPGPVASSIETAARDAGIPADLAVAVAIEEGGVHLGAVRTIDPDDHVPVAGAFELRHGRLDTLALGATLLGTTEEALRSDTALATRAGALVLARLGLETGAGPSLASWRPALERLSGMDDVAAHDYASRVLSLLRSGGMFAARGGEQITLAAHPELTATDVALTAARLLPATAPEYPGAIWFPTSCTNKCTVGRPLGKASVDKIVIHDTEGGWDASVATLQYDPDKSVHYIIDADGSRVGQFRSENDTTYHAGNYFYNETSVGIEHVGTAANPAGYSAELYAKSRDLVASIRTRWTVPLDRTHIIGHYQVPDVDVLPQDAPPCTDELGTCETSAKYGGKSNHRDPGYHWQWCQYMEHLGGSCTCNDAYSLWNCTTDKTEAVRCSAGNVEIEHCATACEVMPIGTDDVCNAAGSGSDPGSGSDTGSGSGSGGDMPAGDDTGGCDAGGGAAGAFGLATALAALVRRRR